MKNRWRPWQVSVAFLFLTLLFGSLKVSAVSPEARSCPTGWQEEAGPDFIFSAYQHLKENFYDPELLDYPKLLNAGLDGVAQCLKTKNLVFSPEKIPADALSDEAEKKFSAEFERARGLAAQNRAALKQHELGFAAVAEFLKAVGDSHTGFLDPEAWDAEKKERNGEAAFSGIGVVLRKVEDSFFYCGWVFPNTPADKAGLQRFDRIMLVDGQPAGNDSAKLVERIRGPRGTKVKLTIERKSERKEFTIKRGDVIHPSTSETVIKDGEQSFGYLHIYTFLMENSWKETLRHVVMKSGEDKVAGFIIDLRGNPGGYIKVLEKILQIFLEAETECFRVKNAEGERAFFTKVGPITKLPLVILVDNDSASASEIMSGVLQEQGRATIVGKKTAGAVSVGTRVELPFESAMSITVYQFFTAKGKKLEKEGVTPDVIIENTKDDILKARDAQLEKATEVLKSKIKKQ